MAVTILDSAIRGLDWAVEYCITDRETGEPVDLSDATIYATLLFDSPYAELGTAWVVEGLDGSLPAVDPTQGYIRLTLEDDVTKTLGTGLYYTLIHITKPDPSDTTPETWIAPITAFHVTEDGGR